MIQAINNKLKEVLPILFAVLATAWLGSFLFAPFNGKISDFPQYYTPVRLMCTGRPQEAYDTNIVSDLERQLFPSMGERVVVTYLPPPSIFWFLPLGFLPPAQASICWKIIQSAALIAAIALLRKTFDLNRKATCWLIAVFCTSGPAFSAAQLEQISLPILLAITVAVWSLKRDKSWLAAVALAVLMLKPQEGLPLLVFLAGAKRYGAIAKTVAILAVTGLIVVALIGQQGVISYIHDMSAGMQVDSLMQTELGPTVRGQLLRIAPNSRTAISVVTAAISLLTYVFIYFSGRRFRTSSNWIGAMLLTAIPLGLVTCLHLHSYDLTLMVPVLVLVMSGPLENALPAWMIGAGFLLLGVFMVPFYIYIHWDFLLKAHWIFNPQFFSLLTMALALAFIAYRYPDKIEKAHDGYGTAAPDPA